MDATTNISQTEKQDILETIKKYNKANQKIVYENFFIYLLLIFVFLILPIGILYTLKNTFSPIILPILIIEVIGVFLLFSPYIGIALIIFSRTRCSQFIFELLEFIFLVLTLIIILIIEINNQSQMYLAFISIIVFFFIVSITQALKQKPLFWNNSFEYYISSILTQQRLYIPEQQDGYSQRPFFRTFNEIKTVIPSTKNFMHIMENYCKFLARKGELISWTITEKNAILNPRVLMSKSNFILGLRSSYKLLVSIYTKQDLTSINIDYNTGEISLFLNYNDYEPLSDVTYHLLALQVLDRFKESILAFTQQNLEATYSKLFPLNKKDIKKFKINRQIKRPALLIMPTIIDIVVGSIILIYAFLSLIVFFFAFSLGLVPSQISLSYFIAMILAECVILGISVGLITLGIELWRLNYLSMIINAIIASIIIIYIVLTIIVVKIYTISFFGDFTFVIGLSLFIGYFYKNREYFRSKIKNTKSLI